MALRADRRQTSLQTFSQTHKAAIQAILAVDVSQNGLLTLINGNDLLNEAGYKFTRGTSAHHFFVAEIAPGADQLRLRLCATLQDLPEVEPAGAGSALVSGSHCSS